QQQSP
ncbi:hypothetical protein ECEC1868_5873, partial [Escherichia coli EC1868]